METPIGTGGQRIADIAATVPILVGDKHRVALPIAELHPHAEREIGIHAEFQIGRSSERHVVKLRTVGFLGKPQGALAHTALNQGRQSDRGSMVVATRRIAEIGVEGQVGDQALANVVHNRQCRLLAQSSLPVGGTDLHGVAPGITRLNSGQHQGRLCGPGNKRSVAEPLVSDGVDAGRTHLKLGAAVGSHSDVQGLFGDRRCLLGVDGDLSRVRRYTRDTVADDAGVLACIRGLNIAQIEHGIGR